VYNFKKRKVVLFMKFTKKSVIALISAAMVIASVSVSALAEDTPTTVVQKTNRGFLQCTTLVEEGIIPQETGDAIREYLQSNRPEKPSADENGSTTDTAVKPGRHGKGKNSAAADNTDENANTTDTAVKPGRRGKGKISAAADNADENGNTTDTTVNPGKPSKPSKPSKEGTVTNTESVSDESITDSESNGNGGRINREPRDPALKRTAILDELLENSVITNDEYNAINEYYSL